MADLQFIIGAGPIGQNVARLLAARGDRVIVASRSGRELEISGVESVKLDATSASEIVQAARGAKTIFNCANPGDYTKWKSDWPPLATAILQAAEELKTVYIITGNLYPYGPVSGKITAGLPDAATDEKGKLRAQIWAEAKAAHDAGKLRAAEVRGSDFVGARVGQNGHISRNIPALKTGKSIQVIGSLDQLHSFTDVEDFARTLIKVADTESAHGKIWHAVTNPAKTQRQVYQELAELGATPKAKFMVLASGLVRVLALFVPFVKEVLPLMYQWSKPYELDDSQTRAELKLEPTDWSEILQKTLDQNG